jgi:putative DNA primase/helicase
VNGNWNDDHLAQEFIRQNEANLKFIAESSQWLIFTDELGWERVSESVVIDKVATMSRDIIGRSSRQSVFGGGGGGQARARHVATIGNKARICAAVALASADPRVRISALDIDRDPNLLGALNGVVNLADGTFHRFNREEMVTRRIACCYNPEAECPSFMQFIEEVQPDPEVRAYLQRLWGYSLTGHCGDHVVAFNFGGGANGKSTALDQMLLEIGGNYSAKISQALIYKRAVGPNPEIELARLDGVRFALGEENSENGSLNEDILKDLTGGDTITARHPYGRHFEYRSQLKVHLHGNHQPRIQGTDDGIWRRFNLMAPR